MPKGPEIPACSTADAPVLVALDDGTTVELADVTGEELAEFERNMNRRDARNAASRRRKTRMKANGPIRAVRLESIGDRDGWVCHICSAPVLRNDPCRAWRPSLDHIRPIAGGGTHTFGNLALAHMACNNDKNASASSRVARRRFQEWMGDHNFAVPTLSEAHAAPKVRVGYRRGIEAAIARRWEELLDADPLLASAQQVAQSIDRVGRRVRGRSGMSDG